MLLLSFFPHFTDEETEAQKERKWPLSSLLESQASAVFVWPVAKLLSPVLTCPPKRVKLVSEGGRSYGDCKARQ